MSRKRITTLIIAAAAFVALALAAFFMGRSSGMRTAEEQTAAGRKAPTEVTATVRTAAVRQGEIRKVAEAYGAVIPAPDGESALAVSYPCRVVKVLVREGQYVSKGTTVLQVEADPDTQLVLARARHAVQSTRQDLESMKAKYGLKLADKAQLAQARMNYDDANAQLESLLRRKAGEVESIKAEASGTAYKVSVRRGDMIQAGQTLLALVNDGRLEVRLGVQPSQVAALKVGAPVTLTPADDGMAASLAGRLRAVGGAINPESRLVDVYVSLPADRKLPLGTYVRGELTVASAKGLLVPYASVLPKKGKEVLFTVKDGKAVRHEVKVGLENGRDILVIGKDLAAGNEVVVQGNYELEDGMAVRVEQAS
jgi:RND family efflux transporter MFP subunit